MCRASKGVAPRAKHKAQRAPAPPQAEEDADLHMTKLEVC